MNLNYGLTFFHFNLREVHYHMNISWARGGKADPLEDPAGSVIDLDMKRAMRRGSYTSLNIYFQSQYNATTGNLGFCSYPMPGVIPNSTDFFRDGCNVDQLGLPGWRINAYDLGYTAVHETGHWLNLLHPFEGDTCLLDGDEVGDTPFQRTPTYGCPPRKKSCPGTTGDDNIHNFMDYSDDCCMDGFTRGQATRMLNYWYLRTLKL
jgi:Pregnancy-associated plasma protein-A